MPGVWVQLSEPACSTPTPLSLLGEEAVVSGQMRHRWGVQPLQSQGKYRVLLVMLNRRICSGRRMEAEGESGTSGTLS